jgi:transposase
MSQNNPAILYVGLDVAKLALQLHLAGRFHSLPNDPKGHTQLLKLLRAHLTAHVLCEATGGYEQAVVRALQAADTPVSIIEAGRVRHFARAQGQRAKTDPIDAAVLTAYGAAFKPAATPAVPPQQQQLADLSQRRRQLILTRTAERHRAEHYTDPLCARPDRQLQKLLDKQIEQGDAAITRIMATEAALAGVAPYNSDSGDQKGVRPIGGGRQPVRCALYMATLSAVRHDRILKEFYTRLRAAGKKPLVALTACMRKLVVLMNHLLKNDEFQLAG